MLVIGVGLGNAGDGQVLVRYGLLGLTGDEAPPFVKRYGELGEAVVSAVSAYAAEVRG